MVAHQPASWADVRIRALLARHRRLRVDGALVRADRAAASMTSSAGACIVDSSAAHPRRRITPGETTCHLRAADNIDSSALACASCSAAQLTRASAAPVPAEPPPVAQPPAQPPAQPVQPTAQPPASPIITPAPQPTAGEPTAAPIAGALPNLSGLSSAARRNASFSGLMPAYAIECVGLTSTQR